jgi:hypothetical protein
MRRPGVERVRVGVWVQILVQGRDLGIVPGPTLTMMSTVESSDTNHYQPLDCASSWRPAVSSPGA